MFSTIRRHQAWLWWIIAGLTIASFVAFGPNGCNEVKLSGLKNGGGRYGVIGDHVITPDEFQHARNEVALRYYLTSQHWPDAKSDFNLPRETYFRLFLIEKQKQLGIQVTPENLAEFAHRILGSARLDDFVNQILKPEGMEEDDFERFLAHEVGAQQLVSVAGLSGKLVTPGEAETLYREDHQELACSMILLSASNYLPNVTVSNAAVRRFYTNQMSLYREPARMQVNYVKFNVTNYWADALKTLTNLDKDLDAEVKRAGTNLVGHAKTPEESRAAIRDIMIRREALTPARRDANEFANQLYNMEPKKPENIETMAKQKGMTVKTTGLFDEVNGPKDMDVLYNFPKAAFQLTAEEPFGGAVTEQDGVYVLGFKKSIPSAVPPFEEVEAKVTEDYRYYQANVLAQQAIIRAYTELTNGLAHGKSFSGLTAELGLKTESLPPFSLDTSKLPESLEERVSLNALRKAAFSTEVGGVSTPGRSQYGFFLVSVERKLPVDETKVKTELPLFIAEMRRARQSDAFNQWFNVQISQDPAFMAVVRQVSEDPQMRSGARRTK